MISILREEVARKVIPGFVSISPVSPEITHKFLNSHNFF